MSLGQASPTFGRSQNNGKKKTANYCTWTYIINYFEL